MARPEFLRDHHSSVSVVGSSAGPRDRTKRNSKGLELLRLLCTAICASCSMSAVAKYPFTVADSIRMSMLADPDTTFAQFRKLTVKCAETRKMCFIITRRGDLTTGLSDYDLSAVDLDQVTEALRKNSLPVWVKLAHFSSSSNRPAIRQARWLRDGVTIAFIGEGAHKSAQVYAVNAETHLLLKMTSHPTVVRSFDAVSADGPVVYIADLPGDWPTRISRGYAVENDTLYDVMGKGRDGLYKQAALYVGDGRGGAGARVDMEPYRFGEDIDLDHVTPSISPDGRLAVVLRQVDKTPRRWWTEYEPLAGADSNTCGTCAYTGAAAPGTELFSKPVQMFRYALVDLRTKQSRVLVDAPAVLYIGGYSFGAHWKPDSSSVILENTFLPLDGVSPAEEADRRRAPSIVEADLSSGSLQRVTDIDRSPLPGKVGGRRLILNGSFIGARIGRQGDVIVTWRAPTEADEYHLEESAYRKVDGRWQPLGRIRSESTRNETELTVCQGLNSAPEICATARSFGPEKAITDLNPELRTLELGTVEVVHWTDSGGGAWVGGLIRPVGYLPGKRYPLVIQTRGFDSKEFLVDGPYGSTSGFAARSLANRGLMVLQVQDGGRGVGSPQECALNLRGYESAVRMLDAKGLIDPSRVGIHGFSRSGFWVQYALTYSTIDFAAASVSDPNSLGLWLYFSSFGEYFPAMIEYERLIGASPWGDAGVRTWIDHDPTFHLDRVHTPLRIDVHEYGMAWWDTYTLLRRHGRPVEYLSFPDGSHNLVKPWERMTSQQGAVDWYDFWLNGHEDPSSTEAEEYGRWEKLCDLQRANNPDKPAFCVPSTKH